MWQYLRQHPGIYMPPAFEDKEPSFFCDTYGVKAWDRYLSLFLDAADGQLIGEASGPYLTSPEAPARIQRAIADPRFIIMLRNPADRAYSLWKWMREHGYEQIRSFEEALAAEDWRSQSGAFRQNHGQYLPNFLYFHTGLYSEQLPRFISTFGRTRVHTIVFEEFRLDPLVAVQEAYRFLRVDPTFRPNIRVHNATTAAHGQMNPTLRESLLQRYASSIKELEYLLARGLRTHWV